MTFAKQNKVVPVCASLAIHLLAAVVLVWGLSNQNIILPEFNEKLNLVWVSLESKNAGPTIQKINRQVPIASDDRHFVPAAAIAQTPQPETSGQKTMTEIPVDGGKIVAEQPGIIIRSVTEGKYDFAMSGRDAVATGTAPAFSGAYPLHRENAPPGYPEIARLRGYEGVVFIALEILPDGCVGGTRISKSSGYAILDQTAVEAVKPWKFEPAKKSGKPYKIWVELPIKFVLHDEKQQS
jgi:TonB family protein